MTAQLTAAATEWVMAVARVAELVAVKVADAVVAAAMVLVVVLVVDVAAATVEGATEAAGHTASKTISRIADHHNFVECPVRRVFTQQWAYIETYGADCLLYGNPISRGIHNSMQTHPQVLL